MPAKNCGFTLVEVIVVAVIVAILAAVALPTYTSYVHSTRQDSATNLAQTAISAANLYYRKTNTHVSDSDLDPNGSKLSLEYNASQFTHGLTNTNNVVTITFTTVAGNVSGSANYRY